MSDEIYIIHGGNPDIYLNSDVIKPKNNNLESPLYEDIRGKIERKNFGKFKYNIVETKKGFMRGGDLHKNSQFNLILSGKIEVWFMLNGKTEKKVIGSNQFMMIKPNTPHLFNYLEDTVMIEYWDGPFEAWYYKPYRNMIDQNFKKSGKK